MSNAPDSLCALNGLANLDHRDEMVQLLMPSVPPPGARHGNKVW